ncbi:MAG: RNA polymerase sigma factor [Gemmataceae bacterium]
MSDESTSLSLLQRARNNIPEAWQRLLFLYGPLVECWCRQWGARTADVEDIRQDVFSAVASALPNFRRDRKGDSFRGWLRVIARNKFLDFCRRQQRAPEAEGGSGAHWNLQQVPEPIDVDVDDDDGDPPEEISGLHQRALELVRSQFEQKTWQAFYLSAVDGQSPADVAAALGTTPANVRKAKSRVLHRLRQELGELLDEPSAS